MAQATFTCAIKSGQSTHRTSRAISLRYRAAAIAVAERPPCFRAWLFPSGAPGFVPPCIRHRFRAFTAGDWHSVPARVRARQRGACAIRAGCIGLID